MADRFEVVVFRLSPDGETRTVGRTADAGAVSGALDAIARDLAALRGSYPPGNRSAAVRPLREASHAPTE